MSSPIPPPIPSPIGSQFGTCCQGCQEMAPTKYVRFYQHIGAVVMMFNRHIRGNLCRNCVNKHFARTTLVTSFFGWWGMISFFLTPFFLLHNVIRYLCCLSLKPASEDQASGTGLAWLAVIIAVAVLSLPVIFIASVAQGHH